MSQLCNEQQVTICACCKHHLFTENNRWHWFCTHPAVERQLGIDFVTGKPCYYTKNDLGNNITGEKHPYCYDVNSGYCTLYEESQ
jgi:hypothetical protein